MGKVTTEFSMSLDGYIAGPNEDFSRLFKWYDSGDTEFVFDSGMKTKISAASARVLREGVDAGGACIMARRMFDIVNGWEDNPPVDAPIFVVTHHPETIPDSFKQPGSRYTILNDDIATVIAKAKAAAGDKNVSIASTSIVQQALQAGLLDEMQIDLVPYLLGGGIPLFKYLGIEPIELEQTNVVVGHGVTHLVFCVIKGDETVSAEIMHS